ncbi:hypothetical protein DAI22_02g237200 [Oryza sativa Japonica Group]|nr:hypothetical protein DAI22_02g237200 [Oryza sativa Japonica Group]
MWHIKSPRSSPPHLHSLPHCTHEKHRFTPTSVRSCPILQVALCSVLVLFRFLALIHHVRRWGWGVGGDAWAQWFIDPFPALWR